METDYRNQPDTLILTAEFDPLRDEGEEYGKRLRKPVITWRFIESKMRFTDILRLESGISMCRKVLN